MPAISAFLHYKQTVFPNTGATVGPEKAPFTSPAQTIG